MAEHTFGVWSMESGNLLDFFAYRDAAEACADELRRLNPDMPGDSIAVIEFDENGMACG